MARRRYSSSSSGGTGAFICLAIFLIILYYAFMLLGICAVGYGIYRLVLWLMTRNAPESDEFKYYEDEQLNEEKDEQPEKVKDELLNMIDERPNIEEQSLIVSTLTETSLYGENPYEKEYPYENEFGKYKLVDISELHIPEYPYPEWKGKGYLSRCYVNQANKYLRGQRQARGESVITKMYEEHYKIIEEKIEEKYNNEPKPCGSLQTIVNNVKSKHEKEYSDEELFEKNLEDERLEEEKAKKLEKLSENGLHIVEYCGKLKYVEGELEKIKDFELVPEILQVSNTIRKVLELAQDEITVSPSDIGKLNRTSQVLVNSIELYTGSDFEETTAEVLEQTVKMYLGFITKIKGDRIDRYIQKEIEGIKIGIHLADQEL